MSGYNKYVDDRKLSETGEEAEEKRGVIAGDPLFLFPFFKMKLTKENFIQRHKQFSLGHLTTEAFHHKTKNLSTLIQSDLAQAIQKLKEVDVDALNTFKTKKKIVLKFHKDIQNALNKGRVFIVGCGATGRLALSIEKIYRSLYNTDKVISFMAGGDYALIRSVESFEDSKNFGATQLNELGFNKADTLIAVTEGGETSFVIGALEEAQRISMCNHWFLYCNPDDELLNINRSKKVIENNKIQKLNLTIGPMAISGSTRMQATTVQMLAVGLAILYKESESLDIIFDQVVDELISLDYSFIQDFIIFESDVYKTDGIITYESNEQLAISILTDTTERAPTFSLYSFEKSNQEHLSLSYLVLSKETDNRRAWEKLLGRKLRALSWDQPRNDIGLKDVLMFDLTKKSLERRKENSSKHFVFNISEGIDGDINFNLGDLKTKVHCSNNLFVKHMILKLLLNCHSTLVMGKLGRIQSNMMSYVKPSNLKLIDRAYRYICELCRQSEIEIQKELIIEEIFNNLDIGDESIVEIVFRKLTKESS